MIKKNYNKTAIEKKNKAFKNWNKYNFIYKKVSEILYEKVNELKPYFKNILILTSDLSETLSQIERIKHENLVFVSQYNFFGDNYLKNSKVFKVFSYFDNLPFSNNKFDLIICNLNFHNILNKKDYLNNLNNILNEGGLLICNFFGENSLVELRRSLILTDEELYNGSFLRIQKNITMNEFSNLLIKSGFKDIVNEKINYQIYYKNIISLLKDIRGIGENTDMNFKEIKISKDYIKLLEMMYKKKFSNADSHLKLSVDIISSCSWKN